MRLATLVVVCLALAGAACGSPVGDKAAGADGLPVDSSVAASDAGGSTGGAETPVPEAGDLARPDGAPITVPLTLYRLIDVGEAGLGTSRSADEVSRIGELADAIWDQAGITFDPLLVRDLEVPSELLAPIAANGDVGPLFDRLADSIDAPDPGVINGFYLREAFGVNGFAPSGTRTFFVVDEPTVPDQRVTSHEIGHLLGLHHVLDDPGRLMFSGTDGEVLSTEEQVVARYVAKGVLDGQR